MKKLFTLIAMCLLGVGAMQAQTINFDKVASGTTSATFGEGYFTMTIGGTTGWNGTHSATSTRYFGTSTTSGDYSSVKGMISSSGTINGTDRSMVIKSSYKGKLTLCVCSTNSTERNITVGSNTAQATGNYGKVKIGDNDQTIYKLLTFDITAGTTNVTTDGGIYLYQVKFVPEATDISYTTKTWSFASMTVPYADNGTTVGGKWYNPSDSQKDRVRNGSNFTSEELNYYADADAKTAGTTTIFEPTKGLKFTTTNSSYSLEIRKDLIAISRSGVVITIPNCKVGQKVTVNIQASAVSRGFNLTNLSKTAFNTTASGTWEEYSATVVADGDVVLTSNNGVSVKEIKLEKPSYSLSVTDIGWASMYLPYAVTIPNGVQAYYAASTTASNVTLKDATTIPAFTGVVVKADEGTVTLAAAEGSLSPITDNLFSGVTADKTFAENDGYVLAGANDEKTAPKFQMYATNAVLAAYKAYLPKDKVPSPAKGGVINFVFDGGTTAINNVDANVDANKATATRKAMVNGKLVVITANGTFNVAGARIK